MMQRRKHEGQLERWARQALRGSLLAGVIAVMLSMTGGPQNVAAEDYSDTPAAAASLKEALAHFTMNPTLIPVRSGQTMVDPQGNSAEKQIRDALLKTAATAPAATCPMCGKATGSCCCGGTDKCSCGK